MAKKICKKLREGEAIKHYEKPKYLCKSCNAVSVKEKELCKPKKSKSA
jgi:hypothetical protein